MASSPRKRSRIPVEEVSDNDHDYEEHSDTDDEDTEEARSDIGENSEIEEDRERQNDENIRPGWRRWEPNDEQFRRLPSTANKGYKPPVNVPEIELEFFQLFFTDNLLQEIITETNRFGAQKI
ncbi:hypothetical protein JTB14_010702 [Gonioctena quinquepunctata]|nr:hypothetical protein JTB14_010702 [Gonioctena quinquepunctata]